MSETSATTTTTTSKPKAAKSFTQQYAKVVKKVDKIERFADDIVHNVEEIVGASRTVAMQDLAESVIQLVDIAANRKRKFYFSPVDKQALIVLVDNRLVSKRRIEQLVDDLERYETAVKELSNKHLQQALNNMYYLVRFTITDQTSERYAVAMKYYLDCFDPEVASELKNILHRLLYHAQVFTDAEAKLADGANALTWEQADRYTVQYSHSVLDTQIAEVLFSLYRYKRHAAPALRFVDILQQLQLCQNVQRNTREDVDAAADDDDDGQVQEKSDNEHPRKAKRSSSKSKSKKRHHSDDDDDEDSSASSSASESVDDSSSSGDDDDTARRRMKRHKHKHKHKEKRKTKKKHKKRKDKTKDTHGRSRDADASD